MLELAVDALGRQDRVTKTLFTGRVWEYETVRNHLTRGVRLHFIGLYDKNACEFKLRLEVSGDLQCTLYWAGHHYTRCDIREPYTTGMWLSHHLGDAPYSYDVKYITELLHRIQGK